MKEGLTLLLDASRLVAAFDKERRLPYNSWLNF